MMSKVSDMIAEFIADHEIRHVFGIIGSGNAHIFDSIAQKGFTEIVCVHHEQAAVMAMGTYFRTNGKITASILTTGAGSTNALTGVVSCWMDSVPGLIISGNENSKFTTSDNPLRIWGVQGYDSPEAVRKVTKYAQRVMDPAGIRFELEKAYYLAGEARCGPVWLDIPSNIQASFVERATLKSFKPTPEPVFQPTAALSSLDIAVGQVCEQMQKAERPLIWLGQGIRLAGGIELIEPLLTATGAPSLVAWNGIDMIDSRHPQVFGRAGLSGQRAANFILQNCDFLLAIGTRMAIPQVGYDMNECARAAKIAVVDRDLSEVVKHGSRISWPICSDAKIFMSAMLNRLQGIKRNSYEPWLEYCRSMATKYPPVGPEHKDKDGFINSHSFIDRLSKIMKDDQVVVTDMGTALLSGHQVLSIKKGQRLMTSTGLGEMGYGLPAAIGASFARNRGEVLCLNCDGGMMMNLQELQTIAHHHLPIKIIIFNNDGYLMIKHTQKLLFKGRYSGTDERSGVSCPDYSKVAFAFGFPSYQIRTWGDFETLMPKVLEEQGPVFCEVFISPEQLQVPKLVPVVHQDGTITPSPLEDLSPLLSREELEEAMLIGIHPKSEKIRT